ncbi:MAG: hypothetical protein EXR28_07125 [Betaproteobacteria bacterium]|nr:hypothetical protein [Betaproteobacteria bacterium]
MVKLPPAQRKLWPSLRPALSLGYVLYGGTAVSLHLGHRRSIDFDFFNQSPLDRAALSDSLGFLAKSKTIQDSLNTLVVLTQGVKLSFFCGLDFGRVGDPLLTEDGVAMVASLDDLMAHQLKVILQRAERKDYLDIAAMLAAGVSLERGLAAARLLFGPAFQPSESLKALVWYKDGDLSSLALASRKLLISAVARLVEYPTLKLRSRRLGLSRHS